MVARGDVKGLVFLLVLLLAWAAGLFAFAQRVSGLTPARDPSRADAIVALTGRSDRRLEAAAQLLEAGKGRRLLISGVNRAASRQDVLRITGLAKPLYDCCVDLGFTAVDTIGNARETAHWARGLGYRHVILVTADFHMPRAMLELRAAAPQLRVTPYAVATGAVDAHDWAHDDVSARRMMWEYNKYLVILARAGLMSLAGKSTD